MTTGTGIIIGMATTTIACGVTSGILNACGRQIEAMYMEVACKSLVACTAVATFVKFIKTLGSL